MCTSNIVIGTEPRGSLRRSQFRRFRHLSSLSVTCIYIHLASANVYQRPLSGRFENICHGPKETATRLACASQWRVCTAFSHRRLRAFLETPTSGRQSILAHFAGLRADVTSRPIRVAATRDTPARIHPRRTRSCLRIRQFAA